MITLDQALEYCNEMREKKTIPRFQVLSEFWRNQIKNLIFPFFSSEENQQKLFIRTDENTQNMNNDEAQRMSHFFLHNKSHFSFSINHKCIQHSFKKYRGIVFALPLLNVNINTYFFNRCL